jgi:hypothetical protein
MGNDELNVLAGEQATVSVHLLLRQGAKDGLVDLLRQLVRN